VLEQVGHRLGVAEVVRRDDLEVAPALQVRPEEVAPDAPEPVDPNANSHDLASPSVSEPSVTTRLARPRVGWAGCRRLWLVTTNDNVRALEIYQRWGMNLVALRRDAIAEARSLKPSIPPRGRNGIPTQHELELELLLDHQAAGR
jgi:hypothetical protein